MRSAPSFSLFSGAGFSIARSKGRSNALWWHFLGVVWWRLVVAPTVEIPMQRLGIGVYLVMLL
jgi:hypothetical protein